jgi:hypothetical protein
VVAITDTNEDAPVENQPAIASVFVLAAQKPVITNFVFALVAKIHAPVVVDVQ